jgi:hypothetical protein
MAGLEHPCKLEIEAIRRILLGADPAIREGIKWKVPSFRTTDYFATIHLRLKEGIGLIFHLGAKVREVAGVPIEDPDGLLKWLAKDRAMVTFAGLDELQQRAPALERLVIQWIQHV